MCYKTKINNASFEVPHSISELSESFFLPVVAICECINFLRLIKISKRHLIRSCFIFVLKLK